MSIYICGDSTAASYFPQDAPLTGWGQALSEWTGGTPVVNLAKAGRSSKSFLAEGRLQAVEGSLKKGDLLLIQFTHNDNNDLVWRHTDPWTSFPNCLSIYVQTARERQAVPVLLTPICVRYYQDGVLQPSHADYPDAIRRLAQVLNVPLIDLYEESFRLVRDLGETESRKLYLHVAPGEFPRYPDGKQDNAHTRTEGARAFARIVADRLRALGLIGQEV